MEGIPNKDQCNLAYEIAEYFYELVLSWKEQERVDLPFFNNCDSMHSAISLILKGSPIEEVIGSSPFNCFDHPELNALVTDCMIVLAGDKEDTNPEMFYDLLKKRFYYANFDQN